MEMKRQDAMKDSMLQVFGDALLCLPPLSAWQPAKSDPETVSLFDVDPGYKGGRSRRNGWKRGWIEWKW